MRVLLVTGKLAESRVREVAAKFGCRVYASPVDVASLIKPKSLARELERQKPKADLILVPGLAKGDLEVVENAVGIKTRRGTRDIADLKHVLENLGKVKLSRDIPADVLLRDGLRLRAYAELDKVNAPRYVRAKLELPGSFLIRDLPVGSAFPMRVVAEIVDAGSLGDGEVKAKAEYYLWEGADIIDIGMDDNDPGRVKELISLLRPLGVPLSIDTMEAGNIQSALDAGIDLVLSFDNDLLGRFRDVATPSVIVPKKGGIPQDPGERLEVMEENIALARERGFRKPIVDLVLQPAALGFIDSLTAYKSYAERHNDDPTLMGVGNVTELMDADSPGVNALLCAAAMECGADLLFTTEASWKTTGCVRELATASKMMFLSARRKSVPANLGIDLLIFKEKHLKRDVFDESAVRGIRRISAAGEKVCSMDKRGYFKIFVGEKIECVHYHGRKPHLVIEGRSAREICDTIYGLGLIEDIGHAMYLGRELMRAEEALVHRRSYRQA